MKIIFTNNPYVIKHHDEISRFLDTDVNGVFVSVRDVVHQGARLITHPLSGSIKPNESPYKSIMVDLAKGSLDFKSLQIVEDAIKTLEKLPKNNRNFTEKILDDFKVIDLDLINSACDALSYVPGNCSGSYLPKPLVSVFTTGC